MVYLPLGSRSIVLIEAGLLDKHWVPDTGQESRELVSIEAGGLLFKDLR